MPVYIDKDPDNADWTKNKGSAKKKTVLVKAVRGAVVPGHKYIQRTGSSGSYEYTYPEDEQKPEAPRPAMPVHPGQQSMFDMPEQTKDKGPAIKTRGEEASGAERPAVAEGKVTVKDGTWTAGKQTGKFGAKAVLPIDQVVPDVNQPRKKFDQEALQGLADSIKREGLLQPIAVRIKDGNFTIIGGERRWRASKLAGLKTIDALVYDVDETKARSLSLLENMARADMDPMEEARGIKELIENHGYSVEKVAEAIGRSVATVQGYMKLNSLHPAIQFQVGGDGISRDIAIRMAKLSEGAQLSIIKKMGNKTPAEQRAMIGAAWNLENQATLFSDVRKTTHGTHLKSVAKKYEEMIDSVWAFLKKVNFQKEGQGAWAKVPLAVKERGVDKTIDEIDIMIKQLQRTQKELRLYQQQAGEEKGHRKRTAQKMEKAMGDLIHVLGTYRKVELQKATGDLLHVLGAYRKAESRKARKSMWLMWRQGRRIQKAVKGSRVTGHKYIERKGSPGSYEYIYPEDRVKESSGNTEPLSNDEAKAIIPLWKFPAPVEEYLNQHLTPEDQNLRDRWTAEWHKIITAETNGKFMVDRIVNYAAKNVHDGEAKLKALTNKVNGYLNQRPDLKRSARDYRAGHTEHLVNQGKAKRKAAEENKNKLREEAAEKAVGVMEVKDIKDFILKPSKDNAVRGMAYLVHQNLVRIGTRGAVKGKITVNEQVLKTLKQKNAKVQVDFAVMLGSYLKEAYKSSYGNARGPKYFLSRLSAPGKLIFSDSENYNETALVSELAGKLGITGRHDYAARRVNLRNVSENMYYIAEAIDKYNSGAESPFTQLFNPETKADDVVKVVKDTKADKSMRTVASQQKNKVAEILASQNDESWEVPKGLNLKAFGDKKGPYQFAKKGVNWILTAEKGILGFDTGLGKTLISLMAAKTLKDQGKVKRSIMVVKVSTIHGWGSEIQKWFPKSKYLLIEGDKETQDRLWQQAETKDYDFIVVGASALQDDEKAKKIKSMEGALFIDEGQMCKNPQSMTHRGARTAMEGRQYAVLLSATPVPNKPEDLFHLLSLTNPGVLGNAQRFKTEHVRQVYDKKANMMVPAGYQNLAKLHKTITPYVFLKTKNDPDVDIEMPEHLALEEVLDMSPEQQEWYDAARNDTLEALTTAVNTSGVGGGILRAITRMRQVAISPALIDKNYKGSEPKIDKVLDEIDTHTNNAPGKPVVVFSQFNEGLYRVRQRLMDEYGYEPEDIVEISGSVSKKKRDKAIASLNSGECKVGLINMVAGGEGLNLQGAANMVIYLHDPWRPSDVAQSTARVWRQGQKSKVTVLHVRHKDTIEERMVEILYTKKRASIALLEGKDDEEYGAALTWADYASLIGLTKDQITQMEADIARRQSDIEAVVQELNA